MIQYLVTGRSIRFSTGEILFLEKDQAQARNGLLKPTAKTGHYELLFDMDFKAGEVFGYRGELPRALVQKTAPTELPVGTYDQKEVLETVGENLEAPKTDDSNDSDDDAVSIGSVKELADALGSNIKETLEFLKKEYEFIGKNGKDALPEELVEKLIHDGYLTEEADDSDDFSHLSTTDETTPDETVAE